MNLAIRPLLASLKLNTTPNPSFKRRGIRNSLHPSLSKEGQGVVQYKETMMIAVRIRDSASPRLGEEARREANTTFSTGFTFDPLFLVLYFCTDLFFPEFLHFQ